MLAPFATEHFPPPSCLRPSPLPSPQPWLLPSSRLASDASERDRCEFLRMLLPLLHRHPLGAVTLCHWRPGYAGWPMSSADISSGMAVIESGVLRDWAIFARRSRVTFSNPRRRAASTTLSHFSPGIEFLRFQARTVNPVSPTSLPIATAFGQRSMTLENVSRSSMVKTVHHVLSPCNTLCTGPSRRVTIQFRT